MALVDPAGVVVGLLDWDVAATFTPPPDYVLRVTQGANVGDVWAGGTYVRAGIDADNRAALILKGTAALTANTTDITQDGAIITQATALTATTGDRTLTQLSGDVRALARAVKILAGNDARTKRQLNAIIRIVAGLLDNIDGT